jgi:DnaK suppressor protein
LTDDVTRSLSDELDRARMQIEDLGRQFDAIVASSEFDSVDDEHDPDGATIGFERAQTAALLDAARRRLTELEAAMERVRAGTYGVCEVCGDTIPAERLAARPASARCVRCARGVH